MCDVEVIPHRQTPHFASNTGGDALPPEVSHSSRCAPASGKDQEQDWINFKKTNKVKIFGISLQKFLTMWVILWIILILWGAIIKKYTYRTKTYSRGRLLQINFYRNTDYIFKKNWGRAPSIGRIAIVRYTNLDFNILFIFVTVEKLGMKTCSHKCFTDKRGVLCTTMSWELLCTTIIKKRFQSEPYTLEWLSHSAGKTGCHFHYCVTDHYVITQLSLPDAEIKHKMPSI